MRRRSFQLDQTCMPAINRFAESCEHIAAWRRHLHTMPELLFDVHRTAAFVVDRLREFGVDEVITGLGRTGVVALIRGQRDTRGRVIGLRADMDALPIQEARDIPHKSLLDGCMHACGHDGHSAMLLGAAEYLAQTRQFDGTVALVFQPAEEGGGGGLEMVNDGLMERFGIDEVYGMHNMPGLPTGQFALREGAMLAGDVTFRVNVTGRGGHAAKPHLCTDPALIVSQLVQAFQGIVSRNTNPLDALVISVTQIHMGDADNVIPQTATLSGTVRTLSSSVRDLAERRMRTVCSAMETAHEASVALSWQPGYPVTVNHARQTQFAAQVAGEVAGKAAVDSHHPPQMGAEDFSYMLQAKPGAFIFLGQGDTAGLHHPDYDFNDEIIPIGCSYWVRLAETAMPLER